jgi:protein-S-isoprenylcysteine O-methyltransferase Ste14
MVCFGLTAIAMVTGSWMIALEDRELEERFGEEYRRYKNNVPPIFPRRTPYNPNQT